MNTYMKDQEQDKLLREAMERRAANVPPLSEDFAEKVLGKLEVRRRKGRRMVALWVSSIAAALVIAFLLWPHSEKEQATTIAPPVIAETTPQPQPIIPEPAEPINPVKSIKPKKQPKPIEPAESPAELAVVEPITTPIEETIEASREEEPVIPPDRQALVDIYLAEELLQVAYQQGEQTEPLRAYIATLEGEELETSHQIIAF